MACPGLLVLVEPARRCWSRTATTMIAPLATCCAELEMLFWTKTLKSVWKISTPKTVPTMVPRPPVSRVPPMTTAAMASSSQRTQCVEDPVVVRAVIIRAAMPQQKPTST